MVAEIGMRNPRTRLYFSVSYRRLGDHETSCEFRRELLEVILRRLHPGEMFRRNPEAVIVWAELVQGLGSWRFHERYDGR